jgi:bacterioferritin-associated ferredoxin
MEPDDELCLCFHITWRKVINYIRIHRIRTPSRLNECGGAGTGCGWCRRQLEKLTEQVNEVVPDSESIEQWLKDRSPNKQAYSQERELYRKQKRDSTSPT